jgi:hypothetical protein
LEAAEPTAGRLNASGTRERHDLDHPRSLPLGRTVTDALRLSARTYGSEGGPDEHARSHPVSGRREVIVAAKPVTFFSPTTSPLRFENLFSPGQRSGHRSAASLDREPAFTFRTVQTFSPDERCLVMG